MILALADGLSDSVVQSPAIQWAAVVIAICGVITVGFQFLQTRSQGNTNIRLKEIDLSVKEVDLRLKELDENQAVRDRESAEREQHTSLQIHQTAGRVRRLDGNVDALGKVAEATHRLVNSAMLGQLLLTKIATRRLAVVTRDPEDERAADLADRLYREHAAAQAQVDAQPGTDQEKKGQEPAAPSPSPSPSGSDIRPAIRPGPPAGDP